LPVFLNQKVCARRASYMKKTRRKKGISYD
jgi:hypothetical protein